MGFLTTLIAGSQRLMILSRRVSKVERLFRVATAAGRIHPLRHVIPDHAELDPFLVVLVQVLENDPPNGLRGLAPVLG